MHSYLLQCFFGCGPRKNLAAGVTLLRETLRENLQI